MIPLSWLVFPALVVAAVVLGAWRLRWRAQIPLVILAVAAGFSLLGLAAEILAVTAVHAAGLWNGLARGVIGWSAIGAVCAETFHYLSFRAGPSMRANRTSGGALMAGLGCGAISMIYPSVILGNWLHGTRAHVTPFSAHGFSFVFACAWACVIAAELGLATLVVLAYRRSLSTCPWP